MYRILIVEDVSLIALRLKKSLEKAGYRVTAMANSGQEALDAIQEEMPDLVLMDIKLAGEMDGIETARHLRDHYDLPFIYITSHADAQTIERARQTGPYNYLLKPFNDNQLQVSLEMAFDKIQLVRELNAYKNNLEQRVEERTSALSQEVKAHQETSQLLRQNNESLERKNERLRGLSFSVTNRFKVPLERLKSFLPNLRENTSGDQQEALDAVSTAVHDLEKALKDLNESLDFEQRIKQQRSATNGNGLPRQVFLVDDDTLTNLINKQLIEEYFPKMEVLTFTKTEKALNFILEAGPPDLLFLDLKMPGDTSIPFLKSLQEKGIETEIFVLSAAVNQAEILEATEQPNVKEFLQKPLNPTELQDIMGNMLKA